MEQNLKKEAVIETKFDFPKKKLFSECFLKICLSDPKNDDCVSFLKN